MMKEKNVLSSISDNTKEILEKLFQENKLNLENVNAKLNEAIDNEFGMKKDDMTVIVAKINKK